MVNCSVQVAADLVINSDIYVSNFGTLQRIDHFIYDF